LSGTFWDFFRRPFFLFSSPETPRLITAPLVFFFTAPAEAGLALTGPSLLTTPLQMILHAFLFPPPSRCPSQKKLANGIFQGAGLRNPLFLLGLFLGPSPWHLSPVWKKSSTESTSFCHFPPCNFHQCATFLACPFFPHKFAFSPPGQTSSLFLRNKGDLFFLSTFPLITPFLFFA